MTRTARRRWSRELDLQVDGIAVADRGPVLVHGYEQPAGGKWIDSVIPGKLAALDRSSGETLWVSPCEVGYGRGFGAGAGREDDAVVLGPGLHGHRIARMRLSDGELVAARDIQAFDEALVSSDLCFCVAPRRITALHTTGLVEAWTYSQPGERYHRIAREGDRLLVVYTSEKLGLQGVLRLEAQTGEPSGRLLEPTQTTIHGLATGAGAAILLLDELDEAVPPDALGTALTDEWDSDATPEGMGLVALPVGAGEDDRPLWCSVLGGAIETDLPDVIVCADSGRLYVARGVLVEVRDMLTGRALGEVTLPGLDEQVSFLVTQGAGLLAEETRVSVFEIPD